MDSRDRPCSLVPGSGEAGSPRSLLSRRAVTDEGKDAILAAVGDAWKSVPGQRLGQLLANWLRDCWPDHLPSRPLGMLSFIEDGDLAHNLGLWTAAHAGRAPAPVTAQDLKVRENRVRRMAARQGLLIVKSRTRDRLAPGFGRYRTVAPGGAEPARFASPGGRGLTLDETEERLLSPGGQP